MKNLLLMMLACVGMIMGCASAAKEKEIYSDTWIKSKIVTSYALNEHLNPFPIQVEVNDQAVTLTGTVENDVERDLAELIAEGVEGVKHVNNQLKIDREFQPAEEEGSFKRYVEDATITAKVKSRLLMNKHTQGLAINVITKNGVVILEGQVGSEIEAEMARQIALNTKEVVDVKNNLKVVEETMSY